MKQILGSMEAAILVGAVGDLDSLLNRQYPHGFGCSAEKVAINDAKKFGAVRTDPGRWLRSATDDPGFRVRVSRAYASLERRGLIERVSMWGDRCTHLAPTDAGRALAAKLQNNSGRCVADKLFKGD